MFLENKDEVLNKFDILRNKLENLINCSFVLIKTNHSSEFDKLLLESFGE